MKYLVLLLAAGLVGAQDGKRLQFGLVPRETVEDRLAQMPETASARPAVLVRLFDAAGCKPPELDLEAAAPDLLCSLAGEGSGVILVGAHVDSSPNGAVDNWSGASLLPSLYQALAMLPRRHRFVFAGFAGGSAHYVASLAEPDRARIKALINLNCLGTGPATMWLDRADRSLVLSFAHIAQSFGLPARDARLDLPGRDDAAPFRKAHIPSVTVHSLNRSVLRALRAGGALPPIQREEYFQTYRMLCAWLTYLDKHLE